MDVSLIRQAFEALPMQVGGPLSSHFAESVSAGRYHAAALAGPMNAATGKAYEGLESTVVYMWGRGLEGQLGNGSYASSSTPQLVEDLQDRRISQVLTNPSMKQHTFTFVDLLMEARTAHN